MKLLPYITNFVKDASKAVKRISNIEFKKTVDNTLTELLGISSLIVTMYSLCREGDQDVLHLWCVHREEVALCPHCGCLSMNVHQEENRCIRHLDVWGKKTFLHFLSRRFKCEDCNKVFSEQLPFVDSHRRQSSAFEMYVYQSCLIATRKAVAMREMLSHSTVKEIFNRLAALKKNSTICNTIRVLGIDEISLKKRHKQYVLVISDISRKCVLAVLPDREKKTLEDWIESLNPEIRKSIRFVSIDMWAPYYQAARSKLSHAKIVVDRFHVMKQLNMRLTKLRTTYQKQCAPETQKLLKGSRWILVRNRSELSKKQEDQLTQILQACPELGTLYLLKEEFRTIFEKLHAGKKLPDFLMPGVERPSGRATNFLQNLLILLKTGETKFLIILLNELPTGL